MNQNSNKPNQPDWEKLLDYLQHEDQDESMLDPEEKRQLSELKSIIAETSEALSSHQLFNSKEKWNAVKERLQIEEPIQQLPLEHNQSRAEKNTQLWPAILTIAAAVALIIIGVQFFKANNQEQKDPAPAYADIKPGTNGATITLSNGQVIQLSGNKSGVVVNRNITYTDGSMLEEEGSTLSEGNKVEQLTASTAKGQTYQFVLPDGTKVWLNADSKIIFPSQFVEEKRRIIVSGEAYFEVAKDKKHPFIVAVQNQEVEVLGTHFNINSYDDEEIIKTTLLEGSVKVTSVPESARQYDGSQSVILKPGQQSALNTSNRLTVKEVDVSKVVAWKNGKFIFDEERIEDVMRKLARWYNVEVVYEGDFSDTQFVGSISRSDNISKILDKITFTQAVHFKIEGRRIYVTK